MKPGIKTTEFWYTMGAQMIGLLALLGYLSPDEAEPMGKAVESVVGGVFMALTGVSYIIGRVRLKLGE